MADADPSIKDQLLNDLSSSFGEAKNSLASEGAETSVPAIPDHVLLRRIGKGSYGEVWLARNTLGTLRAVKIVDRGAFDSDRPYEREFAGIRRFEPVSRSHPSQLNVLHVGRDDAAGLFYYVMELADDANDPALGGTSSASPHLTACTDEQSESRVTRPSEVAEATSQPIGGMSSASPHLPPSADAISGPRVTRPSEVAGATSQPIGGMSSASPHLPPSADEISGPHVTRPSESYSPRTLRSELLKRGRLPCDECLHIGLALATALDHLHRHGLVHRDIKPSNIVFVNGIPKLADIGLVTHIEATLSFVGTEGYLPPEGPGTPQADIFSLGKVLYEMATGRDRQDYPELPTNLIEAPATDRAALAELNEIIVRACHADAKQRYQTAAELHADLAWLQSGKSVTRMRAVERRLKLVARAVAVVTGIAALAALAFFYQQVQTREARHLAEVNLRLAGEKGQLADENGKLARENRNRLVQMQTASGLRAMEANDPATAALWFSEVLKQSAGDAVIEQRERFRVGNLLRYLPKPVGLFHLDDRPASMSVIDGGKRLIAVSMSSLSGLEPVSGDISEWELASGKLVHSFSLTNIWYVELSPSGRWAVATGPGENRLFQVSDELRFVTNLPFGGQRMVSEFSPDEARLVVFARTGTNDEREGWILDIPACRPLTPPLLFTNKLTCVAFDPTGRQLVTANTVKQPVKGSQETSGAITSQARVWDAMTGAPITEWLNFEEDRLFATFSPDGKAMAVRVNSSGRIRRTNIPQVVKVFDLPSGQLRFPPLPHKGPVGDVAFSPDGRYLATACEDHTVTIWNARSGEPVHDPLVHPDSVYGIRFSPDGNWLATDSVTTRRIWDVRTGKMALPLLKNIDVSSGLLAFTPDGSRLFAANGPDLETGEIREWNLAGPQPSSPPFRSEDGGAIFSVRFSPDGKHVVTAGSNAGELQVWDTQTGMPVGSRMVPKWETEDRVISGSPAWSADGRWLAAPSGDGTVRIWDSITSERCPFILRHSNLVVSAEFSPVTNYLVTASEDGTARIWDAVTGEAIGHPLQHGKVVFMARFSPDGLRIATASDDGTARIWDAATGDPLTPPLRHDDFVYDVAFSPDGRQVATASRDGTAKIWDALSGNQLGSPMKHLEVVHLVCFSPNGKLVLTASMDQTVRVWDASTGKPVTPPLKHADGVNACAFSPDSKKFITGSNDGTARIWDATTGEPLCLPFRHRDRVLDVSFSPDGRLIATASMDGTAQLWEVPSLDLPVDQIVSLAQLYAGEKLGSSGTLEPLTSEETTELWNRLPRQLLGNALPTPDELIRWHRRQLAVSESSMNWFAAKFHAQRLQDLEPDNVTVREDLSRIEKHFPPPREPDTPPELIDLSDYYNESLMSRWHNADDGNNLSELPQGVQSFAGTRFDVRGLIEVSGTPSTSGYNYPKQVAGIAVRRQLTRLHFLQATEGDTTVPAGTRVGHYLIHFADGRIEDLPIIYGQDARDWWEYSDEPQDLPNAVVAWKGKNRAMLKAGALNIRLFKRTWSNPTPDVEVTTIDLVAEHPTSEPFLVALTAE